MKQKALVLAICMACSAPAISLAKGVPSVASGLNLGEIKTRSFLGEPFNGEIPILFASNQIARKLKVSLAPDTVYTQLGAEKSPELNHLEFSISTKSKHPTIVIQSISNIHEPFLNFILEIKSPLGSIYQDFTVMLDPKGYNTNQNKQVQKPINKPISNENLLKKQASKYKVVSGDSLSKISQKFKSNHVSLNTMMEAIHLKNPNAFVKNDINRIKRGAILNLPNFKEVHESVTAMAKAVEADKNTSQKSSSKDLTNQAEKTAPSSVISYTVKKGDTLSRITSNFRQKGISFTKLMSAIHTKNPHAFSKNKINRLKSGVVLSIPSLINNDPINHETIANKTPQNKGTISNNKELRPQPIKNIAKLDVELIQQLKSASNEVIGNLEKRVRELRSELSTVNNEFSALKTELKYKNSYIYKQKNKVSRLKESIDELESKHKDYYGELEEITTKITHQETNIDEKKKTVPQNIGQVLNTFFTDKISEENHLVTVKNLSYSALALMLGLLLIQRRKELNIYTPIVTDKPLKTTSKDIIPLSTIEDDFYFSDLSIEATKEPVNREPVQEDFSDDTIHECEELINNLIKDLDNQNKECLTRSSRDLDIDSILNNNPNDFTEEEMTIINNINQKTAETINDKAPNSIQTETNLFEITMDKLVKRVNAEEKLT